MYPHAIKNQRGASKMGGILPSKAPSRWLWMPELVLYGISLLAKQFLETVLDIEVDNPASGLSPPPARILLLEQNEPVEESSAGVEQVENDVTPREISSILIGPAPTILRSHWSRVSEW